MILSSPHLPKQTLELITAVNAQEVNTLGMNAPLQSHLQICGMDQDVMSHPFIQLFTLTFIPPFIHTLIKPLIHPFLFIHRAVFCDGQSLRKPRAVVCGDDSRPELSCLEWGVWGRQWM